MKKVILSVLLCAITVMTYAQKNPLKRAEKELSSGQLDLAKASIEEAMTHEKSKDEQDLWLVRGNIYRAFLAKGDDAAFDEVLRCYDKFKSVATGGFRPFQADSARDGLYRYVMNDAINGYNEKNWGKALKGFDRASMVIKGDTTALQNYLAVAENEEPAKLDQNKVIEKSLEYINTPTKSDKSWVYFKVFSAYLAKDPEDKEGKAIAILDKAIAAYPDVQEFMANKINIYIKQNKPAEAIAATEATIAKGGKNLEMYYLNLGILHENMKNGDKAEAAYKKAIEVNPNYFDALFNLSAYYINKDDKIKQYRAMDNKAANSAEGKKLIEEIKALQGQAIPYLEKVVQPEFKEKPEYGQGLNVLKDAYKLLGNDAKAKEIQAKIDEFYK
jgi:tetratricopeptide (TPR) repeat protein